MSEAKHRYAVLLAGGQGTRFWPQSRILEPKQFLSLYKSRTFTPPLRAGAGRYESLFEQTLLRIKSLIPPKNIFVVTGELYRLQILEFILPFRIPSCNVIFEPEGKNTAPSIGVAMRLININDPLGKVCVLPCDHLIKNKSRFLALLDEAFKVLENSKRDDCLIIFGIPPNRPATGYGYIKVTGQNIYSVEKFLEKPDLKTAKRFLRDGRYFWNSGMFIGSCQRFLQEIRAYLPNLYKQLLRINQPLDINLIWKDIAPISFDYGVIEKSHRLLMLPARDLGWSDLGSWQAWDEVLVKDSQGNKFIADVINLGSRNTTVLGKDRLVAAIGLEDLIVVDTADALLITKKDKSEEVKRVVEILKKNKRQEHYLHKTVKRPWGSYTVLDTGGGFKIKLVEVKPGRSLSLQLHRRRSEHWVVVEGRAKIIKGKKSHYVQPNESTYIPASCVHRLSNPSDSVLLKIVEVQSGGYLEEDDIIRLKDDFGRSNEAQTYGTK